MNDYFNHVNNRVAAGSRALDSQINNIADEVALGFDRIPTEVQLKEGTAGFGTDTGLVDALVVTLPYLPTLTDGFVFFIRITITNTGPATLNINATGAKSIVNSDGSALEAGALVLGTIAQLVYDLTGDRYLLLSYNTQVIATDPVTEGGSVQQADHYKCSWPQFYDFGNQATYSGAIDTQDFLASQWNLISKTGGGGDVIFSQIDAVPVTAKALILRFSILFHTSGQNVLYIRPVGETESIGSHNTFVRVDHITSASELDVGWAIVPFDGNGFEAWTASILSTRPEIRMYYRGFIE